MPGSTTPREAPDGGLACKREHTDWKIGGSDKSRPQQPAGPGARHTCLARGGDRVGHDLRAMSDAWEIKFRWKEE